MTRSLLVYDGSVPLYRSAVDAITDRSDAVVAVPWESEPIQAFLEAQFGRRPFVFLLIDTDAVHVGDVAVRRALRELGVAEPVVELVAGAYPVVADPVGRALHDREPAPIHGSFRLRETAREHVADLLVEGSAEEAAAAAAEDNRE